MPPFLFSPSCKNRPLAKSYTITFVNMSTSELIEDIKRGITMVICVLCLAALVGLLFSCSPKVIPPASVESTKVIVRDRIVHDTIPFVVEREVVRNVTRDTSSHLENTYAESDAVVSGGVLSHSLQTKPQTIKVPVNVYVHDTVTVKEKAETIIKEVERDLTWWQKTKMNLFWVFALVGILFIAYKILKNRIVL